MDWPRNIPGDTLQLLAPSFALDYTAIPIHSRSGCVTIVTRKELPPNEHEALRQRLEFAIGKPVELKRLSEVRGIEASEFRQLLHMRYDEEFGTIACGGVSAGQMAVLYVDTNEERSDLLNEKLKNHASATGCDFELQKVWSLHQAQEFVELSGDTLGTILVAYDFSWASDCGVGLCEIVQRFSQIATSADIAIVFDDEFTQQSFQELSSSNLKTVVLCRDNPFFEVFPASDEVLARGVEPAIEIHINPGHASKATIQDVLQKLSDLHRAAGGLGLEFKVDGHTVYAWQEVAR